MKKEFITISSGKRCIYLPDNMRKELPSLYCIHGGMGLCSDSLMEGLKNLSSIFNLIFVDLRGNGDSEKAHDGDYSLSAFTKDIKEIVEQIETQTQKQCGIFGHSLGGMVAIQILADFPDLFDFAIMSNTAMDDSWQAPSIDAVKKMNNPAVNVALKKYNQNSENDEFVKELAISYSPIYFPELDQESANNEMKKFTYRAASMKFTGNHVYPGMNLKSLVKRINVPVLVISGLNDVVVPAFCQEAIAKELNHGTLLSIVGTGHFPFITKTKVFTDSTTEWWIKTKGELK